MRTLQQSTRVGDKSSRFRSAWVTKRRTYSSAGKEAEQEDTESAKPRPLDKEYMLSLVDGLPKTSVNEQLRFVHDPYMRGYAEADGPELTVSERMDDKDFPSWTDILAQDGSVFRTLSNLARALRSGLRSPFDADIEYVWNLYQSLPELKMLHLPAPLRHSFMKVLGQQKRNEKTMLRYFSAVADIQSSGLRLMPSEWNQALSLAGRYVGHTSKVELTAVMRLWHEMEKQNGCKANAITFNVLFDVASKAGNFVLSEMLYKEMEQRGYKFNRYHHVSLIHFFGLRMDSDGIRAAYKEMVEAGELIDTTVLNCVIVGFLRCGEEYAAERVYERMKAAHVRAPKMPYRNYMSDKVVAKVLNMFSRVSRQTDNSELHNHFQQLSPIVPNLQTFSILLNHFTLRAPAMDKIAQYLDDMQWFQIPMHGSVFLTMFKGFARHGGKSRQVWNCRRLEKVYKAVLSARNENVHGIYISVWMAKWILRAFAQCDGNDRMWEVWAELRHYCEVDFGPEEAEYFHTFLADLRTRPRDSWRFKDKNLFSIDL